MALTHYLDQFFDPGIRRDIADRFRHFHQSHPALLWNGKIAIDRLTETVHSTAVPSPEMLQVLCLDALPLHHLIEIQFRRATADTDPSSAVTSSISHLMDSPPRRGSELPQRSLVEPIYTHLYLANVAVTWDRREVQ